jgi:hypothetical protein
VTADQGVEPLELHGRIEKLHIEGGVTGEGVGKI